MTPTAASVPVTEAHDPIPILPLAIGAGLVAVLALGWAMRRRHPAVDDPEQEPAPPTMAEPPGAGTSPARARLVIAFRPIRAGLNLLSATSENEVVVTNVGAATADDVRVLTRLVSAHAGQDADLAEIYATPIARPAVPAFTLQPGEQRVVTGIAAMPRDAIHALTAGGRPMFVPIVAVTISYVSAGIAGQIAQAFAVGVERVDSSKLAPFWLDTPPRSFDQVAARAHPGGVER